MKNCKIVKYNRAAYLPIVMLVATIALAMAYALIGIAMSNWNRAKYDEKFVSALQIAEAGVNYYMWHLSHDNADYCDGVTSGEPKCQVAPFGPFVHNYSDQSGKVLGTYTLYITPPTAGETSTTVRSIGRILGKSPERTVVATLGMPSFTNYTLLSDNLPIWIRQNETIAGSVFSNGSGMYNEGAITGDASSTELTYNSINWGVQPGVAGPGLFGGSKLMQVTKIDFNRLGVDIINIRNEAKVLHRGDYYDLSGASGYHIKLAANNYTLCRVDNYESRDNRSNHLAITSEICSGAGLGQKSYPADGVIFSEDNVWIDGLISGQKLTVIASDPEESRENSKKKIVVSGALLYGAYDGNSKLGLISQTDILLPRNAPATMEIDAAMIAKEGEVMISSYCSPVQTCVDDQKVRIRVFGSIAHRGGLYWTTDFGGKWSGYQATETVMDINSVLNPPPRFPTTGSYVILNWREQ